MSVLVSICCIAYNHEKYIREALDSFINQKTDFEYEILVHDDASTDMTTSIILEYADKYPHLIRPIIQTENIFSKSADIMDVMKSYITGKYVAICEGDDYWCDEHKLQMQIDFLEKHPDYSACVHNSYIYYVATGEKRLFSSKTSSGNIGMRQIIEWQNVFHASSAVYRKEIMESGHVIIVNGMGDLGWALKYRISGNIYYINKPMSVYRRGVDNSWSVRNADWQRVNMMHIEILKLFNKESNYRYSHLINKQIDKMMINIFYANNEINKLHDMGYIRIIMAGYIGVSVSVFLQLHNYKLYKWIHEHLKERKNVEED